MFDLPIMGRKAVTCDKTFVAQKKRARRPGGYITNELRSTKVEQGGASPRVLEDKKFEIGTKRGPHRLI